MLQKNHYRHSTNNREFNAGINVRVTSRFDDHKCSRSDRNGNLYASTERYSGSTRCSSSKSDRHAETEYNSSYGNPQHTDSYRDPKTECDAGCGSTQHTDSYRDAEIERDTGAYANADSR